MIIYIHGFGSSGEGSKAKLFREYFNSIGEDFIAPSLSYVPELAIKTLQELIRSYKKVYLIGSSLGGYYTLYLSHMDEVQKVVLINPSVKPRETLKRSLGDAPNFYDESTFSWTKEHLEMLKLYGGKKPLLHKLMLLTQKGDELLDYREAVDRLQGCKQIVEEDGNHGYKAIERHFETIREFFAVGNHFKHTTTVKGIGLNNKELANRVGDLYYDNLAEFLEALSQKITLDANADRVRGRKRLSDALDESAKYLANSVKPMNEAWEICKAPTMKWMSQYGYNRKPDFLEKYVIPDDRRDFYEWSEVRDIYAHTRFLPYVKHVILYGNTLVKKLEESDWLIEKKVITPTKYSKEVGDCDVYWRHYRLTRYVASKNNRYFYFDEEIATENFDVFVHYGDDTKELVENVLQ